MQNLHAQLPGATARQHTAVVLLVQRGHRLPGLDLIQTKGEGEAAGQLLDAADVGRRAVQVGPLVLQQLVEQLQHTHTHTRVDNLFVGANSTGSTDRIASLEAGSSVFSLRLTCCRLRMSVLAQRILSVCLVLLRVSLMMSP